MSHSDAFPERPTAPSLEGETAHAAASAVQLRGLRRADAINAVIRAREHAGRSDELFSQSDADVTMYITELLDRIAGVK